MAAVPEHVEHDEMVELIRREATPELHEEIRSLWKTHSLAEDARDLPGLMSTLTDDCVYELKQTGHRWEGHRTHHRDYRESESWWEGRSCLRSVIQATESWDY